MGQSPVGADQALEVRAQSFRLSEEDQEFLLQCPSKRQSSAETTEFTKD